MTIKNSFSLSKVCLATATSIALIISSATSFAKTALPDLGTAAVNTFSIEKELQYGDAYMRAIRSSAPVLSDPVLNQYVKELGDKLVAHSTGVKTPFYFFLLQNDEINAFAFFGGHVGIHSGLFLTADNESELASVLGHEVTHVTQRHLARSIEASEKSGPATIVGMLGAILLTIAAPQAGIAALATTQALATQAKINYTRSHEKEADRIGMQVLVKSGFDPNAAATFFNKLSTRYRFTTKPPQMLLTHPLPESRISEARNRAAQYPHRYTPDNLDFQLAKSRVQVRFSNYSEATALSIFERQLETTKFTFKEAALYGKALALFRLKRFEESEKIIDELLTNDNSNLFYIDTKTDLLIEKEKYEQAITMLIAQRDLKPTSQVISINLAHTYLESDNANKAIPILEESIFLDKENVLPYQLLFEAYRKVKNEALEHYTKAEVLALNADYKGAIDQLNYAHQKNGNNPLQLARIEARIRQFKQADRDLENLK